MRPAFLIKLLVCLAVQGEAPCDAAEIVLEPVGASQWDHRGTLDPADDEYWFEARIKGAGIPPASPGWSSEAIPGSGDYGAPDPVKFGPWRARHGVIQLQVADRVDPTIVSNLLEVSPPRAVLTASLVEESIRRVENQPGPHDDEIQFELEVSGRFGGPTFAAESPVGTPVATSTQIASVPARVSLKLFPAPAAGKTMVKLADLSYPEATAIVELPIPATAEPPDLSLGWADFGDWSTDVFVDPDIWDPAWANYPGQRTFELTNSGGGEDKRIRSQVLDLIGIEGEVRFSATLRVLCWSDGLHPDDLFYASLPIDGGARPPIRLMISWDSGMPPDGALSGGTSPDHDQFRPVDVPSGPYVRTFKLEAAIPDYVQTVNFFARAVTDGLGASMVLEDLKFYLPVDTDGDQMPDDYESRHRLNPVDPGDRDSDLDGDGWSNHAEFVAGTAADNSQSCLRIVDVRVDGSSANVVCATVPNKLYRIEISPDLITWLLVGMDIPSNEVPNQFTTWTLDIGLLGEIPPEIYLRVGLK